MGSLEPTGVIDKAISVLDALESGPLGLAGLVGATGLPRATAHRLAVTLERHGLVDRDVEGRFAIGPRFVTFALPALARPALERLRDSTGESSQLYVRRGDARLCVAAMESAHGLRTIVEVGATLPLDHGSAGRVLRGDPVGTGGWIDSVEERQVGVASVSAPVRDRQGRLAGAVSVSGPVERLTRTPGETFGRQVVSAAREIEAGLEARHGPR